MSKPFDEAQFRDTVRAVLQKVREADPALGDAAVERLGFQIVGFMTNQAYDTREVVLSRLKALSDKLISESTEDYDEAMLKGHGVSEGFFEIYGLGHDELGIPLGIFKNK